MGAVAESERTRYQKTSIYIITFRATRIMRYIAVDVENHGIYTKLGSIPTLQKKARGSVPSDGTKSHSKR